MSCDYHVYCRTCEKAHPFMDANHGDRLMRHLVTHAVVIASMAPLIEQSPETIDFRVHYGNIDPSWFRAHLAHELVVRDEYGKIDGTCGQRFVCSGCETQHYCRRGKNHAGECSLKGV